MTSSSSDRPALRRDRPRQSVARDTGGTAIVIVALVTFFATVPLSARDGNAWWLITLAIGSSLLLATVVVHMFTRGANLFRLLNLLLVVVVVCSLGFYTIAMNLPGQFEGIETRVDALYFTLTTMTTTGYGDIHATGQLARILVSLTFVFDLVFLGLVGAELSRIAGDRRSNHEGRRASATPVQRVQDQTDELEGEA